MLKGELAKAFKMKHLGAAKQILGMRISRDQVPGTLMLSLQRYVEKVFHMQDAKPRLTTLGVEMIEIAGTQVGGGVGLHGEGTLCIGSW